MNDLTFAVIFYASWLVSALLLGAPLAILLASLVSLFLQTRGKK